MHKKLWFWFLAGWFLSLVVSPKIVTGMFSKKSAG